ncbi:hypothetical protein CMO93_01380 [Candidatus Woesearchaeota archaeon]|nr:hypothetical protein [Candidatus Woesearchaeota archaeon]
MRVGLEKRYISTYKNIVREANKAIKKAKFKVSRSKYEKALLTNNISIENKKKRLAKYLHELIISSFSINPKQVNKKSIENLRQNIFLMREIIHKIKSINNYLEESFLKELGIIKKSLTIKALKSKKPEKYLEQARGLSKDYVGKIEHTVYTLMQEIIFFDKKLLRGYAKKEINAIKKEKIEIKDLKKILIIESELLDALEAKIPPANKVKAKLFKKETFNRWIPLVFALLSSFETEHQKEQLIFSKLKNNSRLRKKIENKIKHIVNEKEKILKIKEKRALSMEKLGKISDDYRQVFHEYVFAAGL